MLTDVQYNVNEHHRPGRCTDGQQLQQQLNGLKTKISFLTTGYHYQPSPHRIHGQLAVTHIRWVNEIHMVTC